MRVLAAAAYGAAAVIFLISAIPSLGQTRPTLVSVGLTLFAAAHILP